jgi:mRNA interferase MazF
MDGKRRAHLVFEAEHGHLRQTDKQLAHEHRVCHHGGHPSTIVEIPQTGGPPLRARGFPPIRPHPARFGSATRNDAVNPTPRTDDIVNRGDVWMARLDHLRPVVVLSRLDNDVLRCVVAVEPANEDISGVAVEVDLGLDGHVVRVALPRPGRINCTWVLTSSQEDLIEKVGTLSSAKLNEVENLISMGGEKVSK